LKISRTGALPVGSDSGLADLERMITEEEVQVSGSPGEIRELDIRESYLEFMGKYRGDYSNLEVAVDCSNGMAGLLIRDLLGDAVHYLYEDLDGSFPNHEPNPLVEENVVDLKALVSEKDCDIGLIFDGDGDRVMFVDDKGRFIPPDLITAVIGKYFLKTEKGAVLHDIRTSRAVPEYIRKLGGTPHMWKVGHSFAKRKLREIHAIYGGELAGHYYFRDFYSCDSGILAGLIVLDLVAGMKKEGESFSDLIDLLRKYPNSGETNFRITEKELAMEALKEHFSKKETPTALFDFDGYRVEFKDWWFNVRPSNTEPFLRLVVEAADKELLSQRLSEIREILKPFSE
jgi:phosphomannomutase